MAGKKIGQNAIAGQKGVNLIATIVTDMGFLWFPTGQNEAGIDGTIELRDNNTGEVTNCIIEVQSKVVSGAFACETDDKFHYYCASKDLDYWLKGNVPVILVVSRPGTNEAYWISVKDYFNNLSRRKSSTVVFLKKDNRFNVAARAELERLAVPKNSGITLSSSLRSEKLYSNLLSVEFVAMKIYVAETQYRQRDQISGFLREQPNAGREWILRNKTILSFHDLRLQPWSKICDIGTVESFDIEEWALSSDSQRRREFVELLNFALYERVQNELQYSRKLDCYHFRATKDLRAHQVAYQSIVNRTVRTVFQRYPQEASSEVCYFRHAAFQGAFRYYGNKWYLEISPTYYYTYDGYALYDRYEDLLKGIKKLQKNQAVLGEVVFWADYLGKEGFFQLAKFLRFGKLVQFGVDFGIDDNAWRRADEVYLNNDEPSAKGMPLFGDYEN